MAAVGRKSSCEIKLRQEYKINIPVQTSHVQFVEINVGVKPIDIYACRNRKINI